MQLKDLDTMYTVFFYQRFLVELFYNKYITDLILKSGWQTTKLIDKGSIELVGPFGLEKGLVTLSKTMSNLDTGVITSYALYLLAGLTFFMLIPHLYAADGNLLLILIFGVLSLSKNK